MIIRIFVCLLGVYWSSCLFSNSTFEGNWNALTFTSNQNKTTFLWFRMENRYYYEAPFRSQYLLQPAIAFNASERISFWLGYNYFQGLHDRRRRRQVIWEQMQYVLMQTNAANFILRSRIEEQYSTLGRGMAMRLNQRFTLVALPEAQFQPTFYEEVFINVNHPEWVSNKTISQNRIFSGARVPFNSTVSMLLGYLYIKHYFDNEIITENILSFGVDVSFD